MNDLTESQMAGLKELLKPFEQDQIGKLPKPTKKQTEEVKRDFSKGIRCSLCGAWHHPNVVHLDYVGHAAVTGRLLKVDPFWSYEPLSFDERGLPAFDANGGLWIRLTVCGMSRLGYGDAAGKSGANAIKETIGDAIRNAGMRFGMALDLWHKGDSLNLAIEEDQEEEKAPPKKQKITDSRLSDGIKKINDGEYTVELLKEKFELSTEQLAKISKEVKNDPV